MSNTPPRVNFRGEFIPPCSYPISTWARQVRDLLIRGAFDLDNQDQEACIRPYLLAKIAPEIHQHLPTPAPCKDILEFLMNYDVQQQDPLMVLKKSYRIDVKPSITFNLILTELLQNAGERAHRDTYKNLAWTRLMTILPPGMQASEAVLSIEGHPSRAEFEGIDKFYLRLKGLGAFKHQTEQMAFPAVAQLESASHSSDPETQHLLRSLVETQQLQQKQMLQQQNFMNQLTAKLDQVAASLNQPSTGDNVFAGNEQVTVPQQPSSTSFVTQSQSTTRYTRPFRGPAPINSQRGGFRPRFNNNNPGRFNNPRTSINVTTGGYAPRPFTSRSVYDPHKSLAVLTYVKGFPLCGYHSTYGTQARRCLPHCCYFPDFMREHPNYVPIETSTLSNATTSNYVAPQNSRIQNTPYMGTNSRATTSLSYTLAPSGQLSAVDQNHTCEQRPELRAGLPEVPQFEDYAGVPPQDSLGCFFPVDKEGNQLDEQITLNQTDCAYLN